MLRLLPVLLLILLQPARADDGLPDYLLKVPDSTRVALVAETDTSTLYRYKNGPDGMRLVDKHYMSIGENGVGKQRPWDRRTPLGVYFVSDQLDTGKLHPKYGITAFPLDYPNGWDRLRNRSGDGIWLHGVDPDGGKRPALDTDGCLALPNDRLQMISADIQPLSTPVVITRKLRLATGAQLRERAAGLEAALRAWASSLAAGDLHSYFRMYAQGFSYLGMSRDEWMAFRLEAIGNRVLDDLVIDELSLLADPVEDGLYVSRFLQTLVEGDRRVTTMKRLYWRQNDGGSFVIVAEDNG
jgi:hypothetical protein